MKTLVAHYIPRASLSNTKRLLDAFMHSAPPGAGPTEMVDLVANPPGFFNTERLAAYMERDFMGRDIGPAARAAMAPFDHLAEQFASSDVVVVAYPIYNFSVPAAVKAYFDAVILAGKTFRAGSGGFEGLMEGKRALVLSTCGGLYEGDKAHLDHATPLVRAQFEFMGFSEVRTVLVGGLNMYPHEVDARIETGIAQVQAAVADWYAPATAGYPSN